MESQGFEVNAKDLRSGREGLSGNGDGDRKQLAQCDSDGDVVGDRSETNLASDLSSLTLEKGGSGSGSGQRDAIMKDFERQLEEIATEYLNNLNNNEFIRKLSLELEKRKANIDELSQRLEENVAKERETSEELKRTATEVRELSSQNNLRETQVTELIRQNHEVQAISEELKRKMEVVAKMSSHSEEAFDIMREHFLEEIADLKKELKGKGDRNNELTLELEKSRATNEELNELLEESVARERETSEGFEKKITKLSTKLQTLENEQMTALEEAQAALEIGKASEKWLEITNLKKKLVISEKMKECLSKENQEMRKKIASLEADKENQPESKQVKALSTLLSQEIEENNLLLESLAENLHEYFNKSLQDHVYTTDWKELEGGMYGYVYEGVVGRVFPCPVKGTVPLCRYFNSRSKKHLYTAGWTEDLVKWEKRGYAYEKNTCHIFISQVEGRETKALYRFYDCQKKDHVFTTLRENSSSTRGYVRDGIAGYVYERA